MKWINAEQQVTVAIYDEEHEEHHDKIMTVEEMLDTYTNEGCPTLFSNPEKTGQWIPIADRKPEKHGRYLVSVYDHNRKYLEVGISYFYPEINDFDFLNAYENYYWEVTAWMERPEPYQEKKKCRKKKQ